MRGLKPKEVSDVHPAKVASFTDAWIETVQLPVFGIELNVASFTDAWIET